MVLGVLQDSVKKGISCCYDLLPEYAARTNNPDLFAVDFTNDTNGRDGRLEMFIREKIRSTDLARTYQSDKSALMEYAREAMDNFLRIWLSQNSGIDCTGMCDDDVYRNKVGGPMQQYQYNPQQQYAPQQSGGYYGPQNQGIYYGPQQQSGPDHYPQGIQGQRMPQTFSNNGYVPGSGGNGTGFPNLGRRPAPEQEYWYLGKDDRNIIDNGILERVYPNGYSMLYEAKSQGLIKHPAHGTNTAVYEVTLMHPRDPEYNSPTRMQQRAEKYADRARKGLSVYRPYPGEPMPLPYSLPQEYLAAQVPDNGTAYMPQNNNGGINYRPAPQQSGGYYGGPQNQGGYGMTGAGFMPQNNNVYHPQPRPAARDADMPGSNPFASAAVRQYNDDMAYRQQRDQQAAPMVPPPPPAQQPQPVPQSEFRPFIGGANGIIEYLDVPEQPSGYKGAHKEARLAHHEAVAKARGSVNLVGLDLPRNPNAKRANVNATKAYKVQDDDVIPGLEPEISEDIIFDTKTKIDVVHKAYSASKAMLADSDTLTLPKGAGFEHAKSKDTRTRIHDIVDFHSGADDMSELEEIVNGLSEDEIDLVQLRKNLGRGITTVTVDAMTPSFDMEGTLNEVERSSQVLEKGADVAIVHVKDARTINKNLEVVTDLLSECNTMLYGPSGDLKVTAKSAGAVLVRMKKFDEENKTTFLQDFIDEFNRLASVYLQHTDERTGIPTYLQAESLKDLFDILTPPKKNDPYASVRNFDTYTNNVGICFMETLKSFFTRSDILQGVATKFRNHVLMNPKNNVWLDEYNCYVCDLLLNDKFCALDGKEREAVLSAAGITLSAYYVNKVVAVHKLDGIKPATEPNGATVYDPKDVDSSLDLRTILDLVKERNVTYVASTKDRNSFKEPLTVGINLHGNLITRRFVA